MVVCLISRVEYRCTLRKTDGVELPTSDGSAKFGFDRFIAGDSKIVWLERYIQK